MHLGEVVKGKEIVLVLEKALHSPWILGLELLDKQIKSNTGICLGRRHPDILDRGSGLISNRLGQIIDDVVGFMYLSPGKQAERRREGSSVDDGSG